MSSLARSTGGGVAVARRGACPGASRARSVAVRASDNLAQRPELKKPAEPPARAAVAPPQPPPQAPAPAPPTPAAASGSGAGAPASGAPTVEYQRNRAKAMRSWFQQIKLNEQVVEAQVFGWTRSNEISNGRWVMFGLLVGMMTEYATGYSFPDQIALLLTYLGITDVE